MGHALCSTVEFHYRKNPKLVKRADVENELTMIGKLDRSLQNPLTNVVKVQGCSEQRKDSGTPVSSRLFWSELCIENLIRNAHGILPHGTRDYFPTSEAPLTQSCGLHPIQSRTLQLICEC